MSLQIKQKILRAITQSLWAGKDGIVPIEGSVDIQQTGSTTLSLRVKERKSELATYYTVTIRENSR